MSINNTNNSRTSSRTRRPLPNWRDALCGVRNFYSVTSSSCVPTTLSPKLLFVYYFDLLIDHLTGKAVDRHVHPVMLLTFDHEACKRGRVWRIAAALCYHVNHQVPCPRLSCI